MKANWQRRKATHKVFKDLNAGKAKNYFLAFPGNIIVPKGDISCGIFHIQKR